MNMNTVLTTLYVIAAVVAVLGFGVFFLRTALASKRKLHGKKVPMRNGQMGYAGQKGFAGPIIRNLAMAFICLTMASGAIYAAAGGFTGDKVSAQENDGSSSSVASTLVKVSKELATKLQAEGENLPDGTGTETEIPDVVVNITLEELKLQFADVPQWYSRVCAASTAKTRAEYTGIGDAFAIPLYMSVDWIDQGTRFERNDADLKTNIDTLPAFADFELLDELSEERLAELEKMSDRELYEFYRGQIVERMLRSPQYQLAFASMARESSLIMENNSSLIERYFRFVARCNEIKLEDFSDDFQSNFKEEGSFDAFLAEALREPTEKELKAGKMDYDLDTELLDCFLDELSRMPLGIDKCLQYDPEHPGDIRFLQVTDEVREFGMYFCRIMDYMPSYGVKVMTSTHNWTLPTMRADDRLLEVVEADYQENVPDKNGKIQNAHKSFWMWFPLKDAGKTNRIFAGVNLDDGRFLLAEPTAKPKDNESNKPSLTIRYLEEGTNRQLADPVTEYIAPGTKFDRDPKAISGYTCTNPKAGKGIIMPDKDMTLTFYYKKDSGGPTTYLLTVVCKDEATGQQIHSFGAGRHQAGVTVNIDHPGIEGYVFVSGPSTHKMPAKDDTVTLVYRKDDGEKDYALTIICINDTTGQEFDRFDGGRHKAGESVPIPHPDFGGYTFVSGPSSYQMPSNDSTVTLHYSKNGDGDGGKTPTAGSGPEGNAPTGGGNNAQGNGGNDDGQHQDYDAEKAEADRIAKEKAEAEKRRQEEEAAKKRQEEEAERKRREQEEAARAAEEAAKQQGEQGGVNVNGSTTPPTDTDHSGAQPITGTTTNSSTDANGNTTTIVTQEKVTNEQEVPGGDSSVGDGDGDGYFDPPM